MITSHTLAQSRLVLEDNLFISPTSSCTKDLSASRIQFDEECVTRILDILNALGNPFEFRDSLVNLCSGIEATPDVTNDLLNALEFGETASDTFAKERAKTKSFYAPIRKLNLKTFKHMIIKKTLDLKGTTYSIAAERNLFGRLLVLAKTRASITMEQLFTFSLSPIPWTFGLADGGLVKTCKSKLLGMIQI